MNDIQGLVFDVDTFAVHDGPGIRMAVYLKGCPLACAWCHSPESQRRERELVFARDRCVRCGVCVQSCPEGVHTVDENGHTIDYEACTACGKCTDRCPTGALSIKGEWVSAACVVEQATHLKPFFSQSGGGITLSGGEVTLQPEFAEAVLVGCQAEGIHTVIETCGACSWDRLARLARHTDTLFYDLKLIDSEAHRRWTGASNRQILDNARRLAEERVPTVVRLPLIPGISDTDENVQGIFAFMADVGLGCATLLAYNPSAGAKYEWLGRSYQIEAEPQDKESLKRFVALGQRFGLKVVADGMWDRSVPPEVAVDT